MERNQYIEKLLNDFIFRDSRLGDHPKVRATVRWLDGEDLILLASAPMATSKEEFMVPRLRVGESLAGHVVKERKFAVVPHIDDDPSHFIGRVFQSYRSMIATPLLDGGKAIGVLSLAGVEINYFNEEHINAAQLLAALLAYSGTRLGINHVTPTSIALGKALKRVREDIGITQVKLADRLQQSRITISRWESGAQPPTEGRLYTWCQELGLFAPAERALVTFVDITPRLLNHLKENPEHLRRLSPSQFEQFIAERLDRMGFDVTLIGATSHRDGGIDLIAVPKIRTVGAFLLAGQVKHHERDGKTGREAVDRLLAWKDSHFRLGLLATNTEFTKDARWAAAQATNQTFLRLRDFEDLKRWIGENFYSLENWQEIPDEVNLAPGVTVAIPKPKLRNSLDIWPLSKLNIENVNYD